MAVASMTKAQVVIHGAASTEVVQRIYNLGIIQAVEILDDPDARELPLQTLSDEMAYCLTDFETRLRKVTRALDILTEHEEVQRELIETFVRLKHRLPRQVLADVREHFDYLDKSRQLQALAEQKKHLQDQAAWLQSDLELLQTINTVPFPLADLGALKRANAVIGQIRQEAKASLLEALAAHEERVYTEVLAESGQLTYLFVLYLPQPEEAATEQEPPPIAAILEQHGFDELDLSRYSGRIPEEIQRLHQELEEVQQQQHDVITAIQAFLPDKQAFQIIEDHLENEIQRCKNFQNFAETKKVYFVEGWMKQRDKPRLEAGLREFEAMTEIIFTDADPDDDTVPVILENPSRLQPFEVVTRMFGMPKYTEPDPTPMQAPFFAVFFGLCLTDAGYGILLAVLMTWLLRTYIFEPGAQQLARLLFYCGLSTIVFGALTGGWFGNVPELLPGWLGFIPAFTDAFTVLDPVNQPILFLGIALLLGFVQVCYGISLKMQQRMQRGETDDALLDEGVWLVFVISLFMLLIINASGIRTLPIGRSVFLLAFSMAAVSGLTRIWYYRRDEPNVVKRVLAGLLSLYGFVGIFSDVLSYSRLLALGLATGVIATVVDMLSLMAADVPLIGFLIGIAIFCVGHVLNLVINALGAFIHSGRLQFVEFFSKFFDAGGKKYVPFRFESKYFDIIEQ